MERKSAEMMHFVMLSYETCLKLGVGGFPLKIGAPSKNSFDLYALLPIPENWAAHLTPPTLSELIEACGDQFSTLKICPTSTYNGMPIFPIHKWVATMPKEKEVFKNTMIGGNTPEEAVANLYLTLHK